jgi:hypothetical protein
MMIIQYRYNRWLIERLTTNVTQMITMLRIYNCYNKRKRTWE